MEAFWDIMPCSLVVVDRRLRGAYCLHNQGNHRPDDGGSTHIWNVSLLQRDYTAPHPAVRTWNLTKYVSLFDIDYKYAFRGMEPIRINKTLKQQNTFNYLWHNISYEGEKDLNIRATNFVNVLGIINQIFKLSLVSRHTRIWIYKALARPEGVVLRPLVCWGRGFESRWGHRCLSLVFLCCVVLCR
jgi:hypothetical protein